MKKTLLILLPIILLSCSKNDDDSKPWGWTPRESKCIITFERDLEDNELIELDISNPINKTILDRFRMLWSEEPDHVKNYIVIVISKPTAIPGEQTAIDFYKAMTVDYKPGDKYTVQRDGNTVTVTLNNLDLYLAPTEENDYHMPRGVYYKSTWRPE